MTYSVDAAASRMHTLTSVWDVGYGQGTGVGGRLDIRDGGAGDCSSTVANSINCGYGHALSWNPLPADTYTGNLRPRLLALGWAAHAWGSVTPRKGDVVLAEGKHVGMMTSSTMFAEFRINERGQITGGTPGDQTGSESREGPVYDFGQEWVLRPPTIVTTAAASTGTTTTATTTDSITEVIDAMKATHIIFQVGTGTKGRLYIADVLAGTYEGIPSTAVLKGRLTVLKRAGAKVVEWKNLGASSNIITDARIFGKAAN